MNYEDFHKMMAEIAKDASQITATASAILPVVDPGGKGMTIRVGKMLELTVNTTLKSALDRHTDPVMKRLTEELFLEVITPLMRSAYYNAMASTGVQLSFIASHTGDLLTADYIKHVGSPPDAEARQQINQTAWAIGATEYIAAVAEYLDIAAVAEYLDIADPSNSVQQANAKKDI